MRSTHIYTFVSILVFFSAVQFSFGQTKAKPKDGDGIYSFLKRHDRVGQMYVQDFIDLNKSKLSKSNELLLGVTYQIPPHRDNSKKTTSSSNSQNAEISEKKPSSVFLTEPLFGPQFEQVDIQSDKLKIACFYIIGGHGGPDPGTIAKVGSKEMHEDEYAYDVALRLARNLMIQGATVRIIIQDAKDGIRDDEYLANSDRETCMGEAIPLNQLARLKQRSDKVNELYLKDKKNFNYIRAISLHVDSRSKEKRIDVFFYHSSTKKSKALATTMKNTFAKKYDKHQPGRGFLGHVSERDLYVIKNTLPVMLFVELGNIQNKEDQQRFVRKDNRQALANWMAEGFVADFEKNKK